MDSLLGGLDGGTFAALAGIALVAGFIDSIAGGGGLLTVPALLVAGFDPVAAVAVNKLQGSFGSGSAALAFARARMIAWREALPMAAASFAGSIAGALVVGLLPTHILAVVMPLMLVGMALYFGLSRKIGDDDSRRRIGPAAFTATVALGVGFYDGVFGPGAGSLYMLGFVTLLGFGARRATAHSKLLNFGSNIGGLACFVAVHGVAWPLGLAMGACALVGAQAGSHLALRQGARLIRPMLVAVSCAMALKLLADPANPVHRAAARLLVPAAQPASAGIAAPAGHDGR